MEAILKEIDVEVKARKRLKTPFYKDIRQLTHGLVEIN